MNQQNDFDFNDAMFGLNEERPLENVSTSNDSDIPASISGVGVDADNPSENEAYIAENQQPQEIILAIGLENINIEEIQERDDSGLGTSISKTRNSEFVPEIREIIKTDPTTTGSELNEENYPRGPSNEDNDESDIEHDPVNDGTSKSNNENTANDDYLSSFDLAMEKGYREQAKIYYDDTTSKGLPVKTKHIVLLKDVFKDEKDKNDAMAESGLEELDEFWTENFAIQKAKMLEIDFQTYLECIKKNNFQKVLQIINRKSLLNEPEKQIKNNIKSKETRYLLKNQTINLITENLSLYRSFIETFPDLKNQIQH